MELSEILKNTAFVNSVWIGSAFISGFLFKRMSLPPMLGFLLSGFLMNFLGLTDGSLALEEIADLGIILLLFTIGLKLDLKGLAKPEIWGGATVHALLTIAFLVVVILAGSSMGLSELVGLPPSQAVLIGFALSFSSTVFAVKFLEEKGEMNSHHGRVSIGILIMQDLMAVFFLTISKGAFPSLWALAIPVLLLALRPVLFYIISNIGHGELLPLSGFFIALAIGTTSFSLVGLKPDLGALFVGLLVGNHPRATELSKSLYNFKDLFLVGFFFQIGLTGIPQLSHILIALVLVAALPVKSFIYFFILTRFHRRVRTSMLAALTLSNYSEFGLLVAAIASKKDWISPDWLIIVALALTFSFLLAAPLNSKANLLYEKCAGFLRRFETSKEHPDDAIIDLGNSDILIFGMGPFGTMAYETTRERMDDKVLAVDQNKKLVEAHQLAGRHILWGDATDYDFWNKINLEKIKIIMLTMKNHRANLLALQEIKAAGFQGPVTTIAQFDDELLELEKAGATAAYNIFSEAGAGYADHVCKSTGLVCKTEFVVSGTEISVLKEKS